MAETTKPKETLSWGSASRARPDVLKRKFPTLADLRLAARRRVPRFAFDYVDGGVGAEEIGAKLNTSALDAVEIVPRYGVANAPVSAEVEIFGQRYNAPIGIAPMGLPSLIWPGGEAHFARAAQAGRVPFTLSTSAGMSIEDVAKFAPDVFWFQLYRIPRDDLRINFDMARRAADAGARVLVLTLDVPSRSKRPRELRNSMVIPFRPTLRTIFDVATSPGWLASLMQYGQPNFANWPPYAAPGASKNEVSLYVRQSIEGAFSWEEVARLRETWRGPLVVKGIMHPDDAETAVSLGVDGIQVSNHGGRQFEAAPASIDVLPAIRDAVAGKAEILFDGGIRSGMDVLRAAALGAKMTFAGRAFMYGLGALGGEGADYTVAFFEDEINVALRQCGIASFAEAQGLTVRHPGAFPFERLRRNTA
ncbi:MAG: alpha-hydroxy acid oxidase [Variibacter sp.]